MKLHFFQHLRDSTVANIDQEIMSEVLPYVKTIEALPNHVQNDARRAAELESAEVFYKNLQNAWMKHNILAETIDNFLCEIYSGSLGKDSRALLVKCIQLTKAAFETEHKKRIYSAGVKPFLERFTDSEHKLSSEELYLLITPWKPSFWMSYWGEHIAYIYHQKQENFDLSDLKRQLCDNFHAGSNLIFDSRLKRDFLAIQQNDLAQIAGMLDQYRKSKLNVEKMKSLGQKLVNGKTDLYYVQQIVAYDNYDEYLFGHNLYGIPDLYLRRFVIDLLVENDIIERRRGVLFYSEGDLVNGLNNLLGFPGRQI